MLEKQDNKIIAHIATERAIDELRRQIGIIIQIDNEKALAAYPVEFLSQGLHGALLAAGSSPSLLLTGSRARHLHLASEPASDFSFPAGSLSLDDLQALADPLSEQPVPHDLVATPATRPQALALKLAKYASLLPALLTVEIPPASVPAWMTGWHRLLSADIESYIGSPMLEVVETAQASLPISAIENAHIVSFRSRFGTAVHLALLVGDIAQAEAPLTRVHSSCVTGDILGSLRCDCGDQLKLALEQIAREGNGILLYLHQEGRGIGITNKLRAYQLQEQGLDTYDANLLLGFEEDERDFNVAGAILKKLGVKAIRLLTNNPHKLEAIEKTGIRVLQRVPLVTATGRHNHAYLDAKVKKSGHLL